jgi:hypothetical protein
MKEYDQHKSFPSMAYNSLSEQYMSILTFCSTSSVIPPSSPTLKKKRKTPTYQWTSQGILERKLSENPYLHFHWFLVLKNPQKN